MKEWFEEKLCWAVLPAEGSVSHVMSDLVDGRLYIYEDEETAKAAEELFNSRLEGKYKAVKVVLKEVENEVV